MPENHHRSDHRTRQPAITPWRTRLLIFLLCLSSTSFAITVPEGGSISVGDGSLALGCTGLDVAGDFSIAAGQVDAGTVRIAATGLLALGTGKLIVRGRIDNQGVLDSSQGGSLMFASGCGNTIPVPTLSFWSLLLLTLLLSGLAAHLRFREKTNAVR